MPSSSADRSCSRPRSSFSLPRSLSPKALLRRLSASIPPRLLFPSTKAAPSPRTVSQLMMSSESDARSRRSGMTRSQSMGNPQTPPPRPPRTPIRIAPFAEPTDYFDVRFSPRSSSEPWYLSTSQSARELAAQVSFEKAVLALDEHRGELPRSAWSDDEETSDEDSEDGEESDEEDQKRSFRLKLGSRRPFSFPATARATPPTFVLTAPSNSSLSPPPTISPSSLSPKPLPAPTRAPAPVPAPTWPLPPTPPTPSRISHERNRSLPTNLPSRPPVEPEDVFLDDPISIFPPPGLPRRRWSTPPTFL